MKRSWFGLFLLAVLLAGSLAVTWGMDTVHRPVCRDLNQAAQAAADGDWEEAASLSHHAQAQWEKWAHFRLCFADHGPAEEIDGEFAQLEAYRAEEETGDFSAMCLGLSRKVEAIGQAHGLTLWNLF